MLKIKIHLDVKRCDGDIINRVKVAGNCSLGRFEAWNRSVVDRAWLGGCSPAKEAARPAAITCACSKEERSNETLYFGPVLAQWDDSSCPLSCPEVEEAHEPVKD